MRYTSPVAVCLVLLLTGCGDSTGPIEDEVPASLSVVAGEGQTDTVARPAGDSLVVRLQDEQDRGVGEAVVRWSVTEGGGELAAPRTETGPDGFAHNRWTLGTRAGSQAVEARWIDTAAGNAPLSGTFSAAALPDSIDRISVAADSTTEAIGDSAVAGDTVRYSATAFDGYGNLNTDSGFSWALTDSSVARMGAGGELVAEDSGRAAVVATREAVDGRDSIFVVHRPDSATWSYEFSRWSYSSLDSLPASTARGGLRAIQIEGGFTTPCSTTKDRISLHGTHSGSDVRFRVAWDRYDGGCQTAIDAFTYEAQLLDISPGEYRVRVRYDSVFHPDDTYPYESLRLDMIVRVK